MLSRAEKVKMVGKVPTILVSWSRQESNLDLKFRKLLFYPLNYETNCYKERQKYAI